LLKIRITGVVLAAFALVGVAFAEGTAHAQTYPTHPIRLILPFPAGGPSDIISRVFGAKLGEVLGQQVVSDNRGGASGMIGAEIAARAAPDGYTIFLGTIGVLTLNPNLYQKLPYDPVRDFQPVSLLSSSPYILLVTPSLPAKSIRELVALAKSRPGQLNYASGGVGTGNHLSGELFKLAAGVNITHVPFKGASVAVGDVIAGNVQMLFINVWPALPHVKSGRARALAITSARRSQAAPDIPTFGESGYPAVENGSWHGVVVPARVSAAIIKRLNEELVKIARQPDVKERLESQGAEISGTTPQEFAAFIRNERERWGKVIRAAGVHPE
jgi:tripartite-type tricarboxylate transporter receptor subunit TctC